LPPRNEELVATLIIQVAQNIIMTEQMLTKTQKPKEHYKITIFLQKMS